MSDFETLLKKYMYYIVDVEGTDYIDPHDRRYESDVSFSDDEWKELEKIAKELSDAREKVMEEFRRSL